MIQNEHKGKIRHGFSEKSTFGAGRLNPDFIGGSGTQSSSLLLQGGGFIGLIIGLVVLYIFGKWLGVPWAVCRLFWSLFRLSLLFFMPSAALTTALAASDSRCAAFGHAGQFAAANAAKRPDNDCRGRICPGHRRKLFFRHRFSGRGSASGGTEAQCFSAADKLVRRSARTACTGI